MRTAAATRRRLTRMERRRNWQRWSGPNVSSLRDGWGSVMRRRGWLVLSVLLLVACGGAALPTDPPRAASTVVARFTPQPGSSPVPSATPAIAPGRIVVGFRDGVTDEERTGVHQGARERGALPATVIESVGTNVVVVDVSGSASLEIALEAYNADPRVRYAALDTLVRTSG